MKHIVSAMAGILLLTVGFYLGRSVSQPKSNQTIVGAPREGMYRVKRVLDGDTIQLESGEKVRYHGIDAPELSELWGTKAWEYNTDLVSDKSVRIELDRVTRDQYGRILAFVWVGETMVNEALLREGYARTLAIKGEPVNKYRDRLAKTEQEARQDHRGLWIEEWKSNMENPR